MKYFQLGKSDLQVSEVAYGCMLIGGTWDDAPVTSDTKKQAEALVMAAMERGVNFYDHADIYCKGKSEEVFAEILKSHPGMREKILIQSKCGIKLGPPFTSYDFSYKHIMSSAEGTLRRLGVDHLDVYLLHRPDPLVEPDEVARAFSELKQQGKVRWFGVSNHTPGQIDLLQRSLDMPIVTNQVEINICHTHLLDAGIIYNQNNPKLARNTDLIEYSRLNNITLQAWSPLYRGYLSGRDLSKEPKNVADTAKLVKKLAIEKGTTAEAIVLAWLLHHPAKIQVIPGVTNVQRLQNCCPQTPVSLTRDEWYQLYTAGRGEGLP